MKHQLFHFECFLNVGHPANNVGRPSLSVYVHAREFHNGFDPLGSNVGHTANNAGQPELRICVQACGLHRRTLA